MYWMYCGVEYILHKWILLFVLVDILAGWKLFHGECVRTVFIAGFHLTSSPPCWCTGQKIIKSFGNLTPLLCKTWVITCFCFVHQLDRLIKNHLFSCSEVEEDERVSIANEWSYEWIKVIQSVFNATICLFRRHLGFHFRVVFGRQIYFSQRGRWKRQGENVFWNSKIFFSVLNKLFNWANRRKPLSATLLEALGFLCNSSRETFPWRHRGRTSQCLRDLTTSLSQVQTVGNIAQSVPAAQQSDIQSLSMPSIQLPSFRRDCGE